MTRFSDVMDEIEREVGTEGEDAVAELGAFRALRSRFRRDAVVLEALRAADRSLQWGHEEMRGCPPQHWLDALAAVRGALTSPDPVAREAALAEAARVLRWGEREMTGHLPVPEHWERAIALVERALGRDVPA